MPCMRNSYVASSDRVLFRILPKKPVMPDLPKHTLHTSQQRPIELFLLRNPMDPSRPPRCTNPAWATHTHTHYWEHTMTDQPTSEEIDSASQAVGDALQTLTNLLNPGALVTGWVITATGIIGSHTTTFNLSPHSQPAPLDYGLYRYGYALAESTAKNTEAITAEDDDE